ncbi:MAG: ATP-grasp domain-containing protein, partial [Acidobacteriota bacterium]|nr:ATP-grasp domain-containing protein [Acidobacteriota bacterium]
DPLDGPYFEESIYVTTETRREIAEVCAKAVRALGLAHGPIHAEMRVNSGGVYMLEIAARPIGGLCAKALRFTGCSLEEAIILHSLGRAPARLTPAAPASGVMMIPVPRGGVLRNVSGIDDARGVPLVTDVILTARVGETLVPLPEGASYPGFIFAEGPDSESVESALRKALGRLRFDILATLPQVI